MKHWSSFLMIAALLMTGCSSADQVNGVMTGGMLGSIFGSSIGGLMGGPRGSDAGTAIGMIIGGAVGAAATAPHDQSGTVERNDNNNRYDDYADRTDTYNRHQGRSSVESVDESAQSDALQQEYSHLAIENLRFIDDNNNRCIDAGEHSSIAFEIYNRGNATIYNVAPVIRIAGTKNIIVSPTAIVSEIAPGKGVRYTAELYGKNRLKDGTADFALSFAKGRLLYTVRKFQLSTQGRK